MYDMADLKKLTPLGAGAPAVMTAFQAFDKTALADGRHPGEVQAADGRRRRAHYPMPHCLDVHHKAAVATLEELAEATFVAAALRAGAAFTHGAHLIHG